MISHSGRYVLIFNGEIYNCDEIKNNSQLNKYPFKGDSDTEVLLASIDVFGIDQTLLNIQKTLLKSFLYLIVFISSRIYLV